MEGISRPGTFSGLLKVVKSEDIEASGTSEMASVTVDGRVSDDFVAHYESCKSAIFTTRVNFAAVGVNAIMDIDNMQFSGPEGVNGRKVTMSGLVARQTEGIKVSPLSENIVPPDALLGRLVITDPSQKCTPEEVQRLVEEIARQHPQVVNMLGNYGAEMSLATLQDVASIINKGIDIEDIKRYLFGLRSKEAIARITRRIRLHPDLKHEMKKDESALITIQVFTHNDVMGVFDAGKDAQLVGARVIFPRSTQATDFSMRVQALKPIPDLRDAKLPISFYRTNRSKQFAVGGDKLDDFEKSAKIDTEIVPSFHATQVIFDAIHGAIGGRKAVVIKDQAGLEKLMRGDQTDVFSYKATVDRKPIAPILTQNNPLLNNYSDSLDPMSYAEMQAIETIKDGETGVLFCRYMPDKTVLNRLGEKADKLRAIVFQAPTYEAAPSVLANGGKEEFPLEAHLFIDEATFVALRDFHEEFPFVKIVWSHQSAKRNIDFASNRTKRRHGNIYMFVKPEVRHHITELEDAPSLGNPSVISFCGSSTVRKKNEKECANMSEDELSDMKKAENSAYALEREFTKVYCDHIKRHGKTPIGINGGGPDVMERNGEDLQSMGAISLASVCDLGLAKQTRHTNWDGIICMAGNNISFSLRENMLMSGDVMHFAPGGIGTIQEIMHVLAENKLEMADKIVILAGKKYWKKQVEQFLAVGEQGKMEAKHLRHVFFVDTPDEAKAILEEFEKNETFSSERQAQWSAVISGEETVDSLGSIMKD